LINYFGSLKKLRAATIEEIAAVPGFGPKTAIAIKEALQQTPQPEAIDMATGEVLGSVMAPPGGTIRE
jgi:excinuclease ABC subunit C